MSAKIEQMSHGIGFALLLALMFVVIARDIIPHFRDGNYGIGLGEGVRSIMKHISGEYTSERYDSSPASLLSVWLVNIVGIAGLTGMVVLLWTRWRRDARGSRRRRRSMST